MSSHPKPRGLTNQPDSPTIDKLKEHSRVLNSAASEGFTGARTRLVWDCSNRKPKALIPQSSPGITAESKQVYSKGFRVLILQLYISPRKPKQPCQPRNANMLTPEGLREIIDRQGWPSGKQEKISYQEENFKSHLELKGSCKQPRWAIKGFYRVQDFAGADAVALYS